MFVSKERVVKYIKKKWWIILIGFIVGVAFFSFGVYSNYNIIKSDECITGQRTLLLVSDQLSNSYVDDFITVVSSEEIQKILSDNLENCSYHIDKLETGNGVTLSVTGDNIDAIRKYMDQIQDRCSKIFKQYYANVEIKSVGTSYSDNQEIPLIQMKNIIQLCFPLFLTGLYVYLLLLCDKRLYSRKEIEDVLQMPVYDLREDEFNSEFSQMKGSKLVYGRGLEDLIKIERGGIDLTDFIAKKEELKENVILIIKQESITSNELMDFLEIIKYQSINKVSVKVFMVNK